MIIRDLGRIDLVEGEFYYFFMILVIVAEKFKIYRIRYGFSTEEILIDYKKWTEEEPENVTAISAYAWALQRMGRKAEALALLGENAKAIKQFEEILVWFEEHGYDAEIEGKHPRKRIAELSSQN